MSAETGEITKAPRAHATAWLALKSNIEQYNPSAKLKQLLVASHLDGFWSQAFHQLIQSHEFADALQTAGAALGAFRRTVARAVFAQMNALAHNQGWSAVDGETRDRIVNCLVGELGGDDKAIGEIGRMALGGGKAIKNFFAVGVMLTAAYSGMLSRGRITDESLPAAGDILLYQTRGKMIRNFIKSRISEAEPPIYVLANSLGGIVCVDILATEDLGVRGLITVASQAPLLYEMNCLTSLADGALLPKYFPDWINFYDRNDVLANVGGEVFQGRVRDVEIMSHQPFPQAHSAYWSTPNLWEEVVAFIKKWKLQ